jgi:hypothetical protein
VSKASELLPDPEMPVMTMSFSFGSTKSMFFRLCCRAPRMTMKRSPIAFGHHENFDAAKQTGKLARGKIYREARME